jgi:hypothetical protein
MSVISSVIEAWLCLPGLGFGDKNVAVEGRTDTCLRARAGIRC